jgi:hypothetical protein
MLDFGFLVYVARFDEIYLNNVVLSRRAFEIKTTFFWSHYTVLT